jgi:uncharacterized RDD family membrane protein YckC
MANCPSCSTEVAAGARWCGICHTNVVNQSIGRLASPGRRLGAYFLDVFVPLVAILVMFGIAGAGVSTGTDEGAGLGVIAGGLLFVAYIVWAFILFAKGTTPGKLILGMRVIKEDGRRAGFFTMLIREWIGKAISGMILSLGFLWILFDRDNQGWHDKLMSTYVIRRA